MGFSNGAYATVWSSEEGKGKFMMVRLSISRKNQETGSYEEEFSEYCMFIGKARAKAAALKERDRIQLTNTDVTRRWDKEKNKAYYTFKVFDFKDKDEIERDFAQKGQQQGQQSSVDPASAQSTVDAGFSGSDTDELPF